MLEKADKTLTDNLETLMLRRGLDDISLAKAAGLSRSGTYKIVKGLRWPNPDNLTRLAKALGVSVSTLLAVPGEVPGLEPTAKSQLLELAASLTEERAKPMLDLLKVAAPLDKTKTEVILSTARQTARSAFGQPASQANPSKATKSHKGSD